MTPAPTAVALAGIFVGGASRRMGGRPKGLMLAPAGEGRPPTGAPGETIVARWHRMFDALGIPCVLVGRHDAYAKLDLEILDDDPPGTGPIGGLVALLARARGRRTIAVGCDMPFVSQRLLEKLAGAPSGACAIAPKRGNVWEPLFSRFEGPRPLEVATRRARGGELALFGVLDALDAEPLVLTDGELAELRDWDAPGDAGRAE
jgi:molybdopterin-guanine dinucleotide biosynthesis protein A